MRDDVQKETYAIQKQLTADNFKILGNDEGGYYRIFPVEWLFI